MTLSSTDTARADFTAPQVHRDTRLEFHLDVVDADGNRGGANVAYTIKDHNLKPKSLAGFLRVYDGPCPTFRMVSHASDPDSADRDPDATISDPDGDGIVSYQWRVTTGWLHEPGTRILGSFTTGNPVVENYMLPRVSEPTWILLLLTVTDAKGAQATNDISGSYRLDPEDFDGCDDAPPGTPPTGNAGPDREASPGQRVTLDGRGSTNPHGASSQLAYGWEQVAGTQVALDDPARGDPSFTAPARAAGERLVFRLTVTDRDGETDSDTATVSVSAGEATGDGEPEAVRPIADAGPDLEAAAGASVTLRGYRSVNPHGASEDLAYLWRQLSGPSVTLSGETLAEPSFTMRPAEDGAALEFLLTVTDQEGESASDTVTVTARAEPAVLPTARAGAARTPTASGGSWTTCGRSCPGQPLRCPTRPSPTPLSPCRRTPAGQGSCSG